MDDQKSRITIHGDEEDEDDDDDDEDEEEEERVEQIEPEGEEEETSEDVEVDVEGCGSESDVMERRRISNGNTSRFSDSGDSHSESGADSDQRDIETSSTPAKESTKVACNCIELSNTECHLETKELWDKFHDLGTEMIITKTGRCSDGNNQRLLQIGTKYGALPQMYARSQIAPSSTSFLKVEEVPTSSVSLREACTKSSVVEGQGFVQCSCTKKCGSNWCICKRKSLLCNSRCHNSLSCCNK